MGCPTLRSWLGSCSCLPFPYYLLLLPKNPACLEQLTDVHSCSCEFRALFSVSLVVIAFIALMTSFFSRLMLTERLIPCQALGQLFMCIISSARHSNTRR